MPKPNARWRMLEAFNVEWSDGKKLANELFLGFTPKALHDTAQGRGASRRTLGRTTREINILNGLHKNVHQCVTPSG